MNKRKRAAAWLALTALTIVSAAAQVLPLQMSDGQGMFRLGLAVGEESVWLDECKVKQQGNDYTATHQLMSGGQVVVSVVKLDRESGIVIRVVADGLPAESHLCWAFGACDVDHANAPGTDAIPAERCAENVFVVEGTWFLTYYGKLERFRVVSGLIPPADEAVICDAHQQASPLQLLSSGKKTDSPVMGQQLPIVSGQPLYMAVISAMPGPPPSAEQKPGEGEPPAPKPGQQPAPQAGPGSQYTYETLHEAFND